MTARRKGEYIYHVCKSFTSSFFFLFIDKKKNKKKNALLILVSLEIISIPFTRLFSLLLRQKFSKRPTHPIRLRTTQHTNPIIFQLFQVDSIYFQEQEKDLGPPNPPKKENENDIDEDDRVCWEKELSLHVHCVFHFSIRKWSKENKNKRKKDISSWMLHSFHQSFHPK